MLSVMWALLLTESLRSESGLIVKIAAVESSINSDTSSEAHSVGLLELKLKKLGSTFLFLFQAGTRNVSL